MTDPTVQETLEQFAALLATGDEHERAAWIARARMLGMASANPKAFEAPIRNLGEYLEWDIPTPPVLVEPALLCRGSLLCTVGRAGKGKTQINLNRIMRWACGQPLFPGLDTKQGLPILGPTAPLKTLVVENEGAAGMFHRQVGMMVNASGYLTNEQRDLVKENVLIWGDGGFSGLKLDDEQQLNNVRAGCEKWNPDILFVEPFRGLWRGDENSSTDMANVADALSAIASDYDCGVILTHHERKSGAGDDGEKMSAGRGSTVLEGVVATMENFEVARGGDFRELTWSKVRYGGGYPLLPIRMEWQPGDWWYKHVAVDDFEQQILINLANVDPDPMTIRDLIEAMGEQGSEARIRRALKILSSDDNGPAKVKGMPGAQGSGMRYRLVHPETGSDGAMDF